jgi:hypothetical protein
MTRHVKCVKIGKIPNHSNKYLFNKIKCILKDSPTIQHEKLEEGLTELDALALEAAFIEYYGYDNLCNFEKGGFGFGRRSGFKLSAETKQRMSDAWKRLYNSGYVAPMSGKHHSEKFKKNRSLAYQNSRTPNFGKGEKIRGRNHPCYDNKVYHFFNPKLNEHVYSQMYDFYTKYGLHQSSVSRLISGQHKSVQGWTLSSI